MLHIVQCKYYYETLFYNNCIVRSVNDYKNNAMNISPNTLVSEVVKLNFKTASFFQANNIDYCCGVSPSISDGCKKIGINPEQLIMQLKILIAQKDPDSESIADLELGKLSDHIVKRNHEYIRNNIPSLKKNLEKICKLYGEQHPELFEIKELFTSAAWDLRTHIYKEETMLFPFIKRLESAKKINSPTPKATFGSVLNPIGMMIVQLQNESDRFAEISKLSKNYLLPENACATYEVTLKQLRDFENNLQLHIHLESDILFPMVMELEHE